jgi:hypothetical protein
VGFEEPSPPMLSREHSLSGSVITSVQLRASATPALGAEDEA